MKNLFFRKGVEALSSFLAWPFVCFILLGQRKRKEEIGQEGEGKYCIDKIKCLYPLALLYFMAIVSQRKLNSKSVENLQKVLLAHMYYFEKKRKLAISEFCMFLSDFSFLFLFFCCPHHNEDIKYQHHLHRSKFVIPPTKMKDMSCHCTKH